MSHEEDASGMIGIALIAYNRPKAAVEVGDSIVSTLDDHPHRLICVIDRPDFLGHEPLAEHFEILTHPHMGIAANKNIALVELQGCDHVFLLEDDLLFVGRGWEDTVLALHKQSGIGYFSYAPPYARKTGITKKCPAGIIDFALEHTAQILSMTPEVLERVGAFDPGYVGYGYEHCDYSRRCISAGLHPSNGGYACVRKIHDYTRLLQIPCSVPAGVRKRYIKENSNRYMKGSHRTRIDLRKMRYLLAGVKRGICNEAETPDAEELGKVHPAKLLWERRDGLPGGDGGECILLSDGQDHQTGKQEVRESDRCCEGETRGCDLHSGSVEETGVNGDPGVLPSRMARKRRRLRDEKIRREVATRNRSVAQELRQPLGSDSGLRADNEELPNSKFPTGDE